MTEMPSSVRDKTDALDAAGNTTAAIGKGFAIGSAALVSLALFGAFVTRVSSRDASAHPLSSDVNLLSPIIFASLIFGAMVPPPHSPAKLGLHELTRIGTNKVHIPPSPRRTPLPRQRGACAPQVPYWFSAMTMRSVGEAANAMVPTPPPNP
jgi:Na+/H+-translocating membrane pyrophosphatase